uniref:FAR1 domain-containing protein n=1 Tax=Aegilops tauschii subsp. strangulata TaxID=200361 RepID=A0A453JKB9_AEGTS
MYRLRLDSAPPDRTPRASRMSALETSFRKFAEEPTKSVVRPELGLNFDSLGEAYNFYNLYSREIGFGIRYGKSMLNAEMTKSMQEIVCGCSVRCSSSFVAVLVVGAHPGAPPERELGRYQVGCAP